MRQILVIYELQAACEVVENVWGAAGAKTGAK